nr:hypothetical protein GPGIFMOB_00318 [Acinetobacter gerneri]
MAEQILHGSNVVTAAEQGRRERVAEGVRCGGLRDACLFYGTFEGALKGLVIHVMATHDTAPWIGRMRVPAQKPRTTARNARRADTSAQGRREAQRRCGPRPGPSATMPVHATAARAGWVPSSRVTSRPDPWSPCPPHDDRAVIEIQILDPQLQTLTDPHARSIQKLGEQTMLAFQKTEDANHFIRGQHHRQAPRRPRSSDLLKPGQIRAQHLAVEEQQGRQCLTMRGDRNLALVRQPGQKCLDFSLPKVAG